MNWSSKISYTLHGRTYKKKIVNCEGRDTREYDSSEQRPVFSFQRIITRLRMFVLIYLLTCLHGKRIESTEFSSSAAEMKKKMF